MEPLRKLTARTVVLALDHIDTDQIIPARFLKGTTREGLGDKLFADWRHDAQGRPRPGFALPAAGTGEGLILVAGHDFGCGSSREHAVWALRDYGFRAVVAPSFSDIFRANALRNGLVPVVLDVESHAALVSAPGSEVTLDVEALTLTRPDGSTASFWIEPFERDCLIKGRDELDFLLSEEPAIAGFERARSRGSANTEACE